MGDKQARKSGQAGVPRPPGKRPETGKGRRKAVGRSAAYRASRPLPSSDASRGESVVGWERDQPEQLPPQAGARSAGLQKDQLRSAKQSQEQSLPWFCREVMSEHPMCCLPTDPVDVAARLMVTENIGSLPVVRDLQTTTLIGIVTDRDLTVKVVAEGRDPKGIIVEEVMTPEPVSCHMEDNAQRALMIMAEHQVRRVPVIDDNGCLVGIIAQADIATRIAEPEKTAQVVEEISRSSSPRNERLSNMRH